MVLSSIDGVTAIGSDDAGFAVGVIERANGTQYRMKAGDHLTVWGDDGAILFAGIIIPVPEHASIGVSHPGPSTLTITTSNGPHHRVPFREGQLGYAEWPTLFVNGAARDNAIRADTGEAFEHPSLHRSLRARVVSSLLLSAFYGPIASVYLRPPRTRFIRGVTDPFLEQGSGGVVWWCVARNNAPYDPFSLDSGDIVIVWGKRSPLFFGMVVRDFSSTVVGGRRVHWMPSGYPPRRWASFFFDKTTVVKGTEYLHGDASRPVWVISFPPLPAIGRWLEGNINGGGQR